MDGKLRVNENKRDDEDEKTNRNKKRVNEKMKMRIRYRIRIDMNYMQREKKEKHELTRIPEMNRNEDELSPRTHDTCNLNHDNFSLVTPFAFKDSPWDHKFQPNIMNSRESDNDNKTQRFQLTKQRAIKIPTDLRYYMNI